MSERVVTRRVELMAWRFDGGDDVPDWVTPHVLHKSSVGLTLSALGGEWLVKPGHWLTLTPDGTIGICTGEDFARRYQTLSADIASVQLAVHSTGLFTPDAWNDSIVERAAVAFHDASMDKPNWVPWANTSESLKSATRLAIRMALTAAIATGKPRTLP